MSRQDIHTAARLLATSLGRFADGRDTRASARTILLNAVRLARAEIGVTATTELLDHAMAEPNWTVER